MKHDSGIRSGSTHSGVRSGSTHIADAIIVDCTIAKVQTLADGGIRVTLDLPEQATDAAKQLMDLRGRALRAAIVAAGVKDSGKGVRSRSTGNRKRTGRLESLAQAEANALKGLGKDV